MSVLEMMLKDQTQIIEKTMDTEGLLLRILCFVEWL